jgi:hypothetical protein
VTDQLDIHDLVRDLTLPHAHREPYTLRVSGTTWTKGHVTLVPALIDQLLSATPAGSGEESGSGTAKSRPAARIEAIDTLMLIDDEASRWLYRLGHNDPNDRLDPRTQLPIPNPRATTRTAVLAVITKLHGLHASASAEHKRGIEYDARRWWHQARIVSGWDSAAWRPDNTCPVCEVRRSLRINLTTQTAVCIECREVWDTTTIGLLAEHVRIENAEDQAS